jgi:hypothetical protein
MTLRFFLAHPKSFDDDALEDVASIAHQVLRSFSSGAEFELVLGRDYFNSRFKICGSWNAWIHEVAWGVQYLTRQPIFRAVLVPATGSIGAGTARIVEESLQARKTVVAFNRRALCRRVVGVETVDREDFKGGFRLVFEEGASAGSPSTSSPPSPMPN